MSTVVLLASSPSAQSKSSVLLNRSALLLAANGIQTQLFTLADFDASDLIYARWDSEGIQKFIQAIAASDGLIVSTPVYKAAYSGALKTILDLLPERALENKAALALATGGSSGHLLAVDYALQPVLTALKARHIVGAVFATDANFRRDDAGHHQIEDETEQRLQTAISRLVAHLPNPERSQLRGDELLRQIQAAQISI